MPYSSTVLPPDSSLSVARVVGVADVAVGLAWTGWFAFGSRRGVDPLVFAGVAVAFAAAAWCAGALLARSASRRAPQDPLVRSQRPRPLDPRPVHRGGVLRLRCLCPPSLSALHRAHPTRDLGCYLRHPLPEQARSGVALGSASSESGAVMSTRTDRATVPLNNEMELTGGGPVNELAPASRARHRVGAARRSSRSWADQEGRWRQ